MGFQKCGESVMGFQKCGEVQNLRRFQEIVQMSSQHENIKDSKYLI